MSEEELRSYIETHPRMNATYGKYLRSVKDYLLKNSQYWKGSEGAFKKAPHWIVVNNRGSDQCFHNASIISLSCQLEYVEGIGRLVYSLYPVLKGENFREVSPLPHAWLTDGKDVYEPTWEGGRYGNRGVVVDGREALGDLSKCCYFGVVVDKKYVIQYLDNYHTTTRHSKFSTPLKLMMMEVR